MKRFITVIISILLVLSLCACGEKDTNSDGNSVDLEYHVKLGQIPECEFALGDSVDKIKEHYSSEQESAEEHSDHSHDIYEIIEGEKTVLIDCGTYGYYYVKDNEADGISFIVSYEDAFGFEMGALVTDIEKSLSGLKYTEEDANEENTFFMMGTSGSVLKCNISDYTLMFVFDNDALCATALYVTEDWE